VATRLIDIVKTDGGRRKAEGGRWRAEGGRHGGARRSGEWENVSRSKSEAEGPDTCTAVGYNGDACKKHVYGCLR